MRFPFVLDPQIIYYIIYSQAGSIGKAVIELLMNAVDAQASAVLLRLTRERFECKENGNGFASREDVLCYFGHFGRPHERGDAPYGHLRLGRGQIMAHACTVWRSKAWTMTVNTRFIEVQNMRLVQAWLCPPLANWNDAITLGLQAQQAIAEEQRQEAENQRQHDAEWSHWCAQPDEDYNLWQVDIAEQEVLEKQLEQTPISKYSADVVALIKLGETVWLLERNAAATGFIHVEDYLKLRSEKERDLC